MQIAGNKCKVCGHDITLCSEGKFCGQCETVVHLACEPRDTCEACGQPYHGYERPKADPLSDAVIPPALRSGKSGGPLLAIFVMVLLATAVLVSWYALTHVSGK